VSGQTSTATKTEATAGLTAHTETGATPESGLGT
jgi:hypothetical protein